MAEKSRKTQKKKKTPPKQAQKRAKTRTKLSLSSELQRIKDLERMINMELGTYLVLIEEGSPQQIAFAKQKTRSSLLKYGPDMFVIAQHVGGVFPTFVEDFLTSVDDVVHATGWVDQALITTCFHATERLDNALKESY